MKNYTKIALIPAYMPDEKLIDTVIRLKLRGFSIVVVDDGSSIGYSPVFRVVSDSAQVISCSENRGKGVALKTGLSYIKEHFEPPYIVVTADADGQHRSADIERVCRAAMDNDDTLILGSRKFDKDVPLRSRFGNTVTRTVFRLSAGTKIFDTQTGLRAFSDKMTDKMLSIGGSRYEYEMNMLMYLAREKTPIREIWIDTVYIDGNSSSHFDTVKDSFRIYKEIIKFSASSLTCFFIDYLLYCIFGGLFGIALGNVFARAVSGSCNYILNKKMVFRDSRSFSKTLPQYIFLAVFILVCNTAVVWGLTQIGVNAYIAKILTEILMFSLSWSIQRSFIFRRERKA